MPTLRPRPLRTLALALAVAAAALGSPSTATAGAADASSPSAEVARFRQGERDFANRSCGGLPAYGDGPCATRRPT